MAMDLSLLEIFNGGGEELERLRNCQQKFRKKASKCDENNEDTAFLNEKNPTLQDVQYSLEVQGVLKCGVGKLSTVLDLLRHQVLVNVYVCFLLGCVTGGGDSTVKLWQLELVILPSSDTKVLSLLHLKTLQLDENVQCARISPDNKLRAVALLDNTGHRGDSRNMSVGGNSYVASCGQDNVIRLYEKTEEPLVLENEWEEERAQEDDKELATGEETNVYGGPSVLALPTKKTISSEKVAELLLKCLNIIKKYKDNLLKSKNKGVDKPTLPIIMTAFNFKTTDDYLLEIVKRIHSRQV
ncbi:hypothetical protein QTP88_028555 [Uroleucon formosanum]